MQQLRGLFKNLLEESSITASTSFDSFRRKAMNDPRFKSMDAKDARTAFDEFQGPIKKEEEAS